MVTTQALLHWTL